VDVKRGIRIITYIDAAIDLALYRILGFVSSSSSVSMHAINENRNDSVFADVLTYRLDYYDFIPGRDGESCLLVNGSVITCMMSSFKYLAITLKSKSSGNAVKIVNLTHPNNFKHNTSAVMVGHGGSETRGDDFMNLHSTGPLTISLRGNIVADFFYENKFIDHIYYVESEFNDSIRPSRELIDINKHMHPTLDTFTLSVTVS